MKKIYTLLFVALMAVAGNANKAYAQCATPTNITAADITGTTAKISCDASYGYLTYVYKASTASIWDTIDAESSDYKLTFLDPLTEYVIKAQVECEDMETGNATGTSAWSDEFKFTTADASVVEQGCTVPTGIKNTEIADSSAYITWDGSSEEGYDASYKKDSDTTWGFAMPLMSSHYSIWNLTPSTKYNFRVRKVCYENEEYVYTDWSPIYNFYTTPFDTVGFDYGGKDTTKTTDTTGNGISNNYNLNINVYSADNQIIITNNTEKINEVVVMNMMGAEVTRYNVNKVGNVAINANLAEGNYIVKVIADKKIGAYKVFVR